MDFEAKKSIPNPHVKANPISRLFFFWTLPLLFNGSKKSLGVHDLYDTLQDEQSSVIGEQLLK